MRDTTSTAQSTRCGWFKSSFSSPSQDCVEVRFDGRTVWMRDSKYLRDASNEPADEPIITMTAEQWSILLDELTGHAKLGTNGAVSIDTTTDGQVILVDVAHDTCLHYTEIEWQKFLAGVRAREFDLRGPV